MTYRAVGVSPNYKLPTLFIEKNVKIFVEGDEAESSLNIIREDAETRSARETQHGLGNDSLNGKKTAEATATTTDTVISAGGDETAGERVSSVASLPASNSEDYGKHWIAYDGYLDIRDQLASGFMADPSGKLNPRQSNILLQTVGSKTLSAMEYSQSLCEHLAKDLRASLVSLEIHDFEEIGLEFYYQDCEMEKATGEKAVEDQSVTEKTEAKSPAVTQDDSRTGLTQQNNDSSSKDSASDGADLASTTSARASSTSMATGAFSSVSTTSTGRQTSDSKEEKTSADHKIDHSMAKFYFGTPKPGGCYHKELDQKRNKTALEALLSVCADMTTMNSASADQSSSTPSGRTTPCIIFVRDATKIFDLIQGHRLLARLRDAIYERRTAGFPVFGIFLGIEEESDGHCPSQDQRFIRKIGATSSTPVDLEIPTVGVEALERKAGEQIKEANVRQLKRCLMMRFPQLLDEETTSQNALWDGQDYDGAGLFLSRERLDTHRLHEIVQAIVARAWGKPMIEPGDVAAVLKRKGRASASNTGEDDSRMEGLNYFEERLTKYVVKPGQSSITYDNIILDPATKNNIRSLINIAKMKPTSSSKVLNEELKMSGMLFYGPPGTGKTHLCRAIANDSSHTLIALSAAELSSKWVGETEKMIQAMFGLASKLHPCILFLDEADSLFYRRGSDDKSWERSATNQYLQEMDGLASNNSGNMAPVVIAATNRPMDLDEAFMRRLPFKVYFKLPLQKEREQLLNLFLPTEDLDADVRIKDLVKRTMGFSGSDLKTLCRQAALSWAAEEAQKDKDLAEKQIKLSMRHFAAAFERTAPSTSPDVLEELMKFSRRFSM